MKISKSIFDVPLQDVAIDLFNGNILCRCQMIPVQNMQISAFGCQNIYLF